MRCPKCDERVSKKAFLCKHCRSGIIPHSFSVISTLGGLFSSREFATSKLWFESDWTQSDIQYFMKDLVNKLKVIQGYDVHWGWGGNSNNNSCELVFSYKGANNYLMLCRVVDVLAKNIAIACKEEVKVYPLQGLK